MERKCDVGGKEKFMGVEPGSEMERGLDIAWARRQAMVWLDHNVNVATQEQRDKCAGVSMFMMDGLLASWRNISAEIVHEKLMDVCSPMHDTTIALLYKTNERNTPAGVLFDAVLFDIAMERANKKEQERGPLDIDPVEQAVKHSDMIAKSAPGLLADALAIYDDKVLTEVFKKTAASAIRKVINGIFADRRMTKERDKAAFIERAAIDYADAHEGNYLTLARKYRIGTQVAMLRYLQKHGYFGARNYLERAMTDMYVDQIGFTAPATQMPTPVNCRCVIVETENPDPWVEAANRVVKAMKSEHFQDMSRADLKGYMFALQPEVLNRIHCMAIDSANGIRDEWVNCVAEAINEQAIALKVIRTTEAKKLLQEGV